MTADFRLRITYLPPHMTIWLVIFLQTRPIGPKLAPLLTYQRSKLLPCFTLIHNSNNFIIRGQALNVHFDW